MTRGSAVFIACLLMLLLISHATCARILGSKIQGSDSSSSMTSVEEDDMATLMGSEECDGNDEACVSRRMMADAHLDYIYTQHHKPKRTP